MVKIYWVGVFGVMLHWGGILWRGHGHLGVMLYWVGILGWGAWIFGGDALFGGDIGEA